MIDITEVKWGHTVQWGTCIPETQAIDGGNERCIELPLALEVMDCARPGWVLDAGCALVASIKAAPSARAPIAQIVHLTFAIGDEPIQPRGRQLSFVSADLRDLRIFASRAFDRVVCVSTLEHVGFDNSQYGGTEEANPASWLEALLELVRVTRETLFLTVPYHPTPYQSTKWRYFSPADVAQLVTIVPSAEIAYYARGPQGWYGGESKPYRPNVVNFPEKVNQIVCLKATLI